MCTGPRASLTQDEIDAGQIVNTATVTAEGIGDDPVVADDTVITPIAAQPAVTLTKTGGEHVDANGDGRISAGDTIAFRFSVVNTGAVTLTDLRIDDPMLGGAIDCDIPDIPPGEKADCGPVLYRLTAADIAAGAVVNVAVLSAAAGALSASAGATATVDLQALAATGGVIVGVVEVVILLAGGSLLLWLSRRRRKGVSGP